MSGSTSIMQFSQDIADAEAPPPFPAGTYKAECVASSYRVSPNGTLQLNNQWRIPVEQYPADYQDGDPDGTTLYGRGIRATDDQQGRFNMKKAMQRMGGPTGHTVDANSLIGLWANVEVTHYTTNEGETRAQVNRLLDP